MGEQALPKSPKKQVFGNWKWHRKAVKTVQSHWKNYSHLRYILEVLSTRWSNAQKEKVLDIQNGFLEQNDQFEIERKEIQTILIDRWMDRR